MTLRAKDYCNCDHAQELREWLEVALDQDTFEAMKGVVIRALKEDEQAAFRYERECAS